MITYAAATSPDEWPSTALGTMFKKRSKSTNATWTMVQRIWLYSVLFTLEVDSLRFNSSAACEHLILFYRQKWLTYRLGSIHTPANEDTRPLLRCSRKRLGRRPRVDGPLQTTALLAAVMLAPPIIGLNMHTPEKIIAMVGERRACEAAESLFTVVAQLSDGLQIANVRHGRRVLLDARVYAK